MLCLILSYLTIMTLFTFIPNILSTLFIIFLGWKDTVESRLIENHLCSFASQTKKWILNKLVDFLSILIEIYAQLMHSYEVVGIENIPKDPNKPALMICYHGILPTDMILANNRIYRKYGRFPRAVGDRFLFLLGNLAKEYLFSGPQSRCVRVLQNGHLLVISPGGTREAQFATRNYETLWNNRCGFARVAKEANVDIIPIFTKNIRQVYILPRIFQIILRPIYEKFRIPVVPFIGGFPIKLVTLIGKPIPSNSAETPEELAKIVQKSIDQLIATHQTFPATIIGALKERFIKCDKIH